MSEVYSLIGRSQKIHSLRQERSNDARRVDDRDQPSAPGGAALAQIRSTLPSLRPSDAKVARLLLEAPAAVLALTVAELAAGRRRLRSDGDPLLQGARLHWVSAPQVRARARQLWRPANSLLHEQQSLGTSSPSGEIIAEVLRTTGRALDDVPGTLDTAQFDAVVDAILRAKRICVIGALPSLILAEDAAYRLSTIGRSAEAPVTDTAQRLACTLLDPGDLCLVISHHRAPRSRASRLFDAARSAGATTAAITSFARSRLASAVDHALIAGAAAVSVRVEAMASRFAHLAVLDALYVAVVLKDEDDALRCSADRRRNSRRLPALAPSQATAAMSGPLRSLPRVPDDFATAPLRKTECPIHHFASWPPTASTGPISPRPTSYGRQPGAQSAGQHRRSSAQRRPGVAVDRRWGLCAGGRWRQHQPAPSSALRRRGARD